MAGLVLARPVLVPASLLVLGGLYGAQLAVDGAPLDGAVALFAAGVLLTAELAYWSVEERDRLRGEPGESFRRLALVALGALGGLLVASSLLVLTDVVRARGLAVDVLGAAAAAAVLLGLVYAARARDRADA